MNLALALPTWGEGAWPAQPWSGYRLPAKQLTSIEERVLHINLQLPTGVTASLIGGPDATSFTLTAGVLVSSLVPDWEFPLDHNQDRVFELDIKLTDGTTSAIQPLLIAIEDNGMTTAYEQITESLNILADNVGDLYEKQTATEADVAALQQQFANIDLTSVIDDNAPDSATNVTRSASFIANLFEQAKTDIRAGVDTAYDNLAKIASALTGQAAQIQALEADVAALKSKFDPNTGYLKSEFIPEYLREGGLEFVGFFDPITDTLPTLPDVTKAGNIYKVSAEGTVTIGNGAVSVLPGDTIMSDGDVWIVMGRSDLVASVNGKVGAVVLTAGDISYDTANASGLTATTIKGALDEIWAKLKAKIEEIGEISQLLTPTALKARIAAAAGDGVVTAAP